MKNLWPFQPTFAGHRSRQRRFLTTLLLAVFYLFPGSLFAWRAAALTPSPTLDAKVPYLNCAPGYTATYYVRNLRSPDGLAFAPNGLLYIVEEEARRVKRVNKDGSTTVVLDRLKSPEGITFDGAGNLYAVEDTFRGRLIRLAPDSTRTTLAQNLRGSEDVAIGRGPDGSDTPTIYVTESNVQFGRNPFDLQTGITAISAAGDRTPVIEHALKLGQNRVALWSYAGLAMGPDDRLYVTNELSGTKITRRIALVSKFLTFTSRLLTHDSVFAVDPVSGTQTLIASDLLVPEGLSFSADGDFPLYVAEENVGKRGRLSRIEQDGRRTTVCSGFRGIEDVVVDTNSDLYVSEDLSGSVIRIRGSPDPGPVSALDAKPSNERFHRRLLERISARPGRADRASRDGRRVPRSGPTCAELPLRRMGPIP
jgi:sugar lactone lactonase YvrE